MCSVQFDTQFTHTAAADSTTGQTETSESDYSPTQRRGGHTTSDMDGYDSDDEIIPRPRVMRLTAYEIIIINLPWFGLSLMYLLLTVEGKVMEDLLGI